MKIKCCGTFSNLTFGKVYHVFSCGENVYIRDDFGKLAKPDMKYFVEVYHG